LIIELFFSCFSDITCSLPWGQGPLLKRIVDSCGLFEDVSESDGKSSPDLCYEETVGRVCRQLAPRGIILRTHDIHFIKCIPYRYTQLSINQTQSSSSIFRCTKEIPYRRRLHVDIFSTAHRPHARGVPEHRIFLFFIPFFRSSMTAKR
jgi:hypothetical protein